MPPGRSPARHSFPSLRFYVVLSLCRSLILQFEAPQKAPKPWPRRRHGPAPTSSRSRPEATGFFCFFWGALLVQPAVRSPAARTLANLWFLELFGRYSGSECVGFRNGQGPLLQLLLLVACLDPEQHASKPWPEALGRMLQPPASSGKAHYPLVEECRLDHIPWLRSVGLFAPPSHDRSQSLHMEEHRKL